MDVIVRSNNNPVNDMTAPVFSLLVPRLSRPNNWSNVFVDCIHVIFCRPLGLVAGFNAICNACLAGVPSGSLKMCPVNLSLF